MTPLEWSLLAYAVIATLLLVVALGTVDEQRAELHKLRCLIHPATRNRKASR